MTSTNKNRNRPATNRVARPRPAPAMPSNYPVITAQQALADGTQPWSLKVIASRLSRTYPGQAAELRRVAAQLAALTAVSNDNVREERRAA